MATALGATVFGPLRARRRHRLSAPRGRRPALRRRRHGSELLYGDARQTRLNTTRRYTTRSSSTTPPATSVGVERRRRFGEVCCRQITADLVPGGNDYSLWWSRTTFSLTGGTATATVRWRARRHDRLHGVPLRELSTRPDAFSDTHIRLIRRATTCCSARQRATTRSTATWSRICRTAATTCCYGEAGDDHPLWSMPGRRSQSGMAGRTPASAERRGRTGSMAMRRQRPICLDGGHFGGNDTLYGRCDARRHDLRRFRRQRPAGQRRLAAAISIYAATPGRRLPALRQGRERYLVRRCPSTASWDQPRLAATTPSMARSGDDHL